MKEYEIRIKTAGSEVYYLLAEDEQDALNRWTEGTMVYSEVDDISSIQVEYVGDEEEDNEGESNE